MKIMQDELIVDGFAGGGGASEGIRLALGRDPDLAYNHDADALAMHRANHPGTRHICRNIMKVDPLAEVGHRPVGLAWFSPDCRHHSKAKGGAPVKREVRDLAWVVVLRARRARPRVIILENVEEFRDWGPLLPRDDGKWMPDAARKGETFQRWVGELRRLGYKVEWREIRAFVYGTATIRRRLYVIARRDGRKIVWPEPTHADPKRSSGKLLAWRTAADAVIDWSLPCHSIFLTREEGRKVGVNRPLAENTMARIFKGVKRHVIDADKPFYVPVNETAGGFDGDCSTGKSGANHPQGGASSSRGGGVGDRFSVAPDPASPFIVPVTHHGDARVHGIEEPLRTVTTAHRGEHALVTPFITKFRQGATGHALTEPLATVTSNSFLKRPGGAAPLGIVVPHLSAYYGDGNGGDDRTAAPDEPLRTVTTENRHAVAAVHLQRQFGASVGSAAAEPVGTVMAGGGGKTAVVAAFMAQHNYLEPGHPVSEPLSTIVTKGCTQAVVAAELINLKGSDRRGSAPGAPVPAITAQGWHLAETRAFLTKYYGTDQDQSLEEPLHTATTKARFGLVTVHGEPYQIVDIGMRMLSPREIRSARRSLKLWCAPTMPPSMQTWPVAASRPKSHYLRRSES